MKITIEINGVSTPQGVANAVSCFAGAILKNNNVDAPLASGRLSGNFETPDGHCTGTWKLTNS